MASVPKAPTVGPRPRLISAAAHHRLGGHHRCGTANRTCGTNDIAGGGESKPNSHPPAQQYGQRWLLNTSASMRSHRRPPGQSLKVRLRPIGWIPARSRICVDKVTPWALIAGDAAIDVLPSIPSMMQRTRDSAIASTPLHILPPTRPNVQWAPVSRIKSTRPLLKFAAVLAGLAANRHIVGIGDACIRFDALWRPRRIYSKIDFFIYNPPI